LNSTFSLRLKQAFFIEGLLEKALIVIKSGCGIARFFYENGHPVININDRKRLREAKLIPAFEGPVAAGNRHVGDYGNLSFLGQ
jgi:hypothetical protein